GGATVFTNGQSNTYFTLVAGFEETVSSVNTNGAETTLTFNFDDSDSNGTNFFKIYAQTSEGNNLTGEDFTNGNVILSGNITGNDFFGNFTGKFNGPYQDFDKNGTNDYPGFQSVSGSGSSNIVAGIDFYD